MRKKIVIAGGAGFLGQALEEHFTSLGWTVDILTRNPKQNNHIAWNGHELGTWSKCLDGCNVLINLCGQSVDCRYTAENKKRILDSRIIPTLLLNKAMRQCTNPPTLFLNASSSTVYIHSEHQPMTEKEGIKGQDFSMSVVQEWEDAFFQEEIEGSRKVALRTSIVLGNKGGAWPKLKKIIKLGLGGQQGSGSQMVSWISERDYCRSIEHIINTKYLEGPINISSPSAISNKAFMRKLSEHLKPLIRIPQPKWLLELGAVFMRTETELLLKSRYVMPERLLNSDFEFEHVNVEDLFPAK